MKVIVEESAALPLVSMTVAFKAGSAHDPVGKEGLARASSRMIRRGGAGMTPVQIEEAIDRLGGDFSADVGFGWTAVSADVLGRNAETMAELVGKLVAGPAFEPTELDKLKREIEAEIVETRDNDRTLAGRALRREIFQNHPYARRVGGYLPTLATLTDQDARTHHGRVFTRSNAIVVFSGDVNKRRARDLAGLLTAGLPDGKAPGDPIPEPTARPGRHLVFVDKPDRTQTQMYVGALGAHPHDDDLTPFQVATAVLGGTFTARMMQQVRVQRGWSYGAYARLGLERHREMFTMWAAPAATDAPACLALLLELLEGWRATGVSDDELSFTKRYLRRSHVFEIDTAQKRAQQRLEAELLDLPAGYHEGYTERVRAVSRRQADRAVAQHIDPQNLVIAVVGSHDEIGAKIEAAIPGLTSKTVVPYDLELSPGCPRRPPSLSPPSACSPASLPCSPPPARRRPRSSSGMPTARGARSSSRCARPSTATASASPTPRSRPSPSPSRATPPSSAPPSRPATAPISSSTPTSASATTASAASSPRPATPCPRTTARATPRPRSTR